MNKFSNLLRRTGGNCVTILKEYLSMKHRGANCGSDQQQSPHTSHRPARYFPTFVVCACGYRRGGGPKLGSSLCDFTNVLQNIRKIKQMKGSGLLIINFMNKNIFSNLKELVKELHNILKQDKAVYKPKIRYL